MESAFVASAVIAAIRNGDVPTGPEANDLDRMPTVEALRAAVGPEDCAQLLRLVGSSEEALSGLCVSLLKQHIDDDVVRNELMERWASASPYLRNRLMWRLLDRNDLPADWHARFQDFVFSEWEVFAAFNKRFFGSPDAAIPRLLARMGSSSFPDSKKWIYFCTVPTVVDDLQASKILIDLVASRYTWIDSALLSRLASVGSGATLVAEAPLPLEGTSGVYVARCVAERLRRGHLPDEAESELLNRLPLIDDLRTVMVERDLNWLLPVVAQESGERAGLFTSLLRGFSDRHPVQAELRALWDAAPAKKKAHLLWRILDDPALPEVWHRRLFDFVMGEWEVFQAVSVKFFGPSEQLVVQVLKRYADASFPESKKWAYLCRLPGASGDPTAERALIAVGMASVQPFTRFVAERLMNRFFDGQEGA